MNYSKILIDVGRCWWLLAISSVGFAADAQDQAADKTVDQQEMVDPVVRPVSNTDYIERGEALQDQAEVVWFEVAGERHWLAVQPARGAAYGNILLLASMDASANGSDHLATLRFSLPSHGWQTHYLNVPSASSASAIIAAARKEMAPAENTIVICEGDSCATMLSELSDAVTGSVFINVGLAAESRILAEDIDRWKNYPPAVLILQEHPRGWPTTLTLPADFELHLLPVGRVDQSNSRVLRKLRGWLKRRLQIS